MRGSILGINGQSLGEFIDGLVVLALAVINDAERAMGEAVLRRDGDGLAEGFLGQLQFVGPEKDHAEIG